MSKEALRLVLCMLAMMAGICIELNGFQILDM